MDVMNSSPPSPAPLSGRRTSSSPNVHASLPSSEHHRTRGWARPALASFHSDGNVNGGSQRHDVDRAGAHADAGANPTLDDPVSSAFSSWRRVASVAAASSAFQKSVRRSREKTPPRGGDPDGLNEETDMSFASHVSDWPSLAALFSDDDDDDDDVPPPAVPDAPRAPTIRGKQADVQGSVERDTSVMRARRRTRAARRSIMDRPLSQPVSHPVTAGPSSPSRSGQPPASPSFLASPTHAAPEGLSFEDPDSFLEGDPNVMIPSGDDPLAYAASTRLLESDDSDDDETRPDRAAGAGSGEAPAQQPSIRCRNILSALPSLTPAWRGILKCALAYLIASLFTYVPALTRVLSATVHEPAEMPVSNAHMIATIVCYYHPAKTRGAMVEADYFAVGAFVWAMAVSEGSMACAVWLNNAGLPTLGHVVTVVFWIGVSMACVAWAKVRVGKPTFNTACSMIAVICFVIIAKEGSVHLGQFETDKVLQTTFIVFIGTVISNIVCFCLWPQSATDRLQQDIDRSLVSFAFLLKTLTKVFLLDDPTGLSFSSEKLKRAIEDHHSSFTSLKKDLADAKLEWPFDVRIHGMEHSYDLVVRVLNELAQHLNGLRSSCGLQFELINAQRELERSGEKGKTAANATPADQPDDARLPHAKRSPGSPDAEKTLQEEAAVFNTFVENVGPHMRSLTFICNRILGRLRTTFAGSDKRASQSRRQPADFDSLRADLSNALRRFEVEQNVAIKRIYTVYPSPSSSQTPLAGNDGQTRKADSPAGRPFNRLSEAFVPAYLNSSSETVFLLYFFVFNLEEFARDLLRLIDAMEEVWKAEVKVAARRQMPFWERIVHSFQVSRSTPRRLHRHRQERTVRQKIAYFCRVTPEPVLFPPNLPHALNTLQTPMAMTRKARAWRFIWGLGTWLREPDTKFAIKAGVGAAILSAPAFIDSLRPIFTEYRGEWALVSFMVVLSPTVGQSNFLGIHRVLGTLFGATVAWLVYSLFPDNNVVLPIFGFFFSLPCFYYIVCTPYATTGRFVLLTYNLTALYSYNLRVRDVEVQTIAFHRSVAVVIGVLWGLVINRLIWPYEARRELSRGLSQLLFSLSWLYQRLVLSYSTPPEVLQSASLHAFPGSAPIGDLEAVTPSKAPSDSDPLLSRGALANIGLQKGDFQTMELHLQVMLIKLEGLLAQTKHEPRLKGPFPVKMYRDVLAACQNILDKLQSISAVTTRSEWYTDVRRDFVVHVNAERRTMVGQVLLTFWLLASAFRLKTPLPPYLPPAAESRQRLMEKIRELPAVKRRIARGSSRLVFYSYVLAMKDIIDQLEALGEIVQCLFGVLGGDRENFESLFTASDEELAGLSAQAVAESEGADAAPTGNLSGMHWN